MKDEMEIPEGTPIIIAASAPLKLFSKDGRDKWNPTLAQVNGGTYDYIKLNRVSGFIDGNVAPYGMLVGFDGTLALPAMPEFTQHGKALKLFNRVLLEMLLGGIYTEAVAPEDIFHGILYKTGYVRSYGTSGKIARFHYALRDKSASPLESIALLDRKPITIANLTKAINAGRKIVSKCDPLSHEIVLAGCTHFVSGALAEALTCLWTSIEQLVSRIWRTEIEEKASGDGVPQRSGFLKDYMVWTTSARIELLFQKGIINSELYCSLNDARKARNSFIHSGNQPDLAAATAALSSLFYLMSLCTTDYRDIHTLDEVCKSVEAKCILRPRAPGPLPKDAVKYWREITPIPGEKKFKGKFNPYKLQFRPIASFDPKQAKKIEMKQAHLSKAHATADGNDEEK